LSSFIGNFGIALKRTAMKKRKCKLDGGYLPKYLTDMLDAMHEQLKKEPDYVPCKFYCFNEDEPGRVKCAYQCVPCKKVS
jgi:hypothetical protein